RVRQALERLGQVRQTQHGGRIFVAGRGGKGKGGRQEGPRRFGVARQIRRVDRDAEGGPPRDRDARVGESNGRLEDRRQVESTESLEGEAESASHAGCDGRAPA